jgi:hypothetical protein
MTRSLGLLYLSCTTLSRLLGPNWSVGTDSPLLLLWLDLDFVRTLRISCWIRCMNEQLPLFDFTTLPSGLYLRKHRVAPSRSETKKFLNFSNAAIWKKGWTLPHEKCRFLLAIDFLGSEITNLTSFFTWQNKYLLSIEWYQEWYIQWINNRLWGHWNQSLFRDFE